MLDPVTIKAGLMIGETILGGIFGRNAEKKKRDALIAGRDRGNAEWNRSYNDVNQMYAPYRESGEGALGRMDRTMGGDMSDFNVSPGYNFRKSEGMRDVGNVFSGRGGGGNAMKALVDWNQNMATNEFGNWWDRNSGMADRGLAATSGTAGARQNTASGISRNEMIAAGGIADSHSEQGAIMNNAMVGGVGNYLYGQERGWWGGGKKKKTTTNDGWES